MNDPSPHEPPAAMPAESAAEPGKVSAPPQPWPAWYALLTSWVWPATTTARMAHVSQARAYCVHVLSLVGIVLAAMFLGAWSEVRRRGELAKVFREFTEGIANVVEQIFRDPLDFLLVIGITFGLIELLFALIALSTCALGARDENIRESQRHALRRALLHTPHFAVALLLAGIVCVETFWQVERVRSEIFERFELMHPPPEYPEDSNNKRAMQEYWAALQEHNKRQWQFAMSESYLLRSSGLGFIPRIIVIPAAIFWVLWALYRGVCAPRPTKGQARDPLCRNCGYNLTGQSADGRCSECGTLVADSIHPDPARAPAWSRRRQIGQIPAYARTLAQGIRHPAELARNLTLTAPRADAMRFLAINAALCAAALAISILVFTIARPRYYYMDMQPSWVYRWGLESMAIFCPMMLVGVLWTTGLAALVAALIVRGRDGRSILAWTGQAVAYGSGYLVLWVMFACLWTIAIIARDAEWIWLGELTGIAQDTLKGAAWMIPNAVIAIGYVLHTARCVRGVRYAWR